MYAKLILTGYFFSDFANSEFVRWKCSFESPSLSHEEWVKLGFEPTTPDETGSGLSTAALLTARYVPVPNAGYQGA
jgi:hypothetical protein